MDLLLFQISMPVKRLRPTLMTLHLLLKNSDWWGHMTPAVPGGKKLYWYLNGSSLFLEIGTRKKGGIFPSRSRIDSSLCVHPNTAACLGTPSTIKASQFNGPLSGPFSFLSHPKVTAWFPVIHFRLISEETAGYWQEDGWRVCSVLSTCRSYYHSSL